MLLKNKKKSILLISLLSIIGVNNALAFPIQNTKTYSINTIVHNAYVYGVNRTYPADYQVIYRSCDSIIRDYYTSLDACRHDMDCDAYSIPFPSTQQILFQVYGINGNRDNALVSYKGECRYKTRELNSDYYTYPNQKRTEKGWTKVTFNPASAYWSNQNQRFLGKTIQSVVTTSESISLFNPEKGVKKCGYDGISNVKDGNYLKDGFFSAKNDVSDPSTMEHYENLDYVIAGQSLRQNLGIYSKTDKFSLKNIIVSSLFGEITPDSPQIAGECNSMCTDPGFEVYRVPDRNNIKLEALTRNMAAAANKWGVVEFTNFKRNPRSAIPDGVLFRDEVKINRTKKDADGNTYTQYDLVLPGGALFGYKNQSFWLR